MDEAATTGGAGARVADDGGVPSRGRPRVRGETRDRSTSTATATATATPRTNESFFTGVLLLLLVVFLWTGSNFLTQFQLTKGYDKPFAVTYLNTSSFALYLVPFACLVSRRKSAAGGGQARHLDEASFLDKLGFRVPQGSLWRKENSRGGYAALSCSSVESLEGSGADEAAAEAREQPLLHKQRRRLAHPASSASLSSVRPSSIDGRRPQSTIAVTAAMEQEAELAPLDLHETLVLAAQFTIVWFLANLTLNVALEETSVASATTLSSTSGFFTLAIGSLVGVESFSVPKLGSVLMSFLGVFLVAQADAKAPIQGPSNPTLGDVLALASAFFYALYVSLLKKRIGSESRVSMPLFFGFVGLINIVCLWPAGLLLHMTSLERIELPQGALMWAGVATNMAITFVSDMAYLVAMLKSSPLVATVGLSLTIPLALLIDLARGSHSGGVQADIGSVLVLASFVCIGLADRAAARIEAGPTESNE
ncbi:hypothetical protein FA10DRAFT_263706 [Acaromyces ingoldii]|uniref:EamA domain-containing protein n=1 Tax=Acaromyces ingoldii TaxID=215250 RepID=A0A316YY26_9BASI|nr:hypothetical protein FA10DRAFT_263706 [Acaromyces ingoldii]PWN92983.1 hypothetical protein FA10DRAFT_263706 [Acaromyces ingoldii]